MVNRKMSPRRSLTVQSEDGLQEHWSGCAGQRQLLRAVGVARMRRSRHAIPRQGFRQRVLERGGLEAQLVANAIEHVTGRPPRVGPVWAGVRGKVVEWD